MKGNGTGVERCPVGIRGFDELAGGGLPRGRVTLVIGTPGAGKTSFALQALAHGVGDRGEPGIFVAFEERAADIRRNASSFEWFPRGAAAKRLDVIDGRPVRAAVRSGPIDLDGLLAVLDARVKALGARRIVFDGLNALLVLFETRAEVRREVLRLADWLAARELTTIVTFSVDPAEAAAIRHLHLQSLADCVVLLGRETTDGITARSVQVVKLRGGSHSPHAVPLLITPQGLDVWSVSAAGTATQLADGRVPTGIERLDAMLDGGYHRGTWVLVTGLPGTAKSTLAGALAEAACRRGERTLYVSFDEAAERIVRNMESVGIRLEPHRRRGLLEIRSAAVREGSASEHAFRIQRELERTKARVLIVDPISAWVHVGGRRIAAEAVMPLLAFTRSRGITVLSTALTGDTSPLQESTELAVSTVADTWIQLSYLVHAGERNRALTIVKSRGTCHSNQVREMTLSDAGVALADVYTAGGEVLMGTLRWEKEEQARQDARRHVEERERERRDVETAIREARGQVARLRRQIAAGARQLKALHAEERAGATEAARVEQRLRGLRRGDAAARRRR